MINVDVRLAETKDRLPIRNMMELYSHDLSEYWDCDLDDHGQYGYLLDKYWTEETHKAFVFTVEGRYVGFALVNNAVNRPENELWMAQFFVLRKYRRRGVATTAATAIFNRIRGKWEIGQIPKNRPAQAFWRRMVEGYTNGRFMEMELADERWSGPLQCFDNRAW